MKHLLTLLGMSLASMPLLAQSPPALRPDLHRAGAAQPPAVAALRTTHHSPLSRDLQQLFQYAQGAGLGGSRTASATTALRTAFPLLSVNAAGGSASSNSGPSVVLVRITARNVAALRPALEARGFVTIAERGKLHFIEGELPLSQLAPGAAGIGALTGQGLLGVRAIWQPMTSAGRFQNQADYGLQVNRVRAARPTGYDGAGQRIGVMSDSYNARGGAAAGVTAGELPADVQVLQDRAAGQGTDEGRAMIELVHDLAPGAGKAFSAIFRGEADFADQMLRLADPTLGNCNIIVDDISYLAEPMFQDGVVAQAVNEASNRLGVTYFGSAGNGADESCEYVSPVFKPVSAEAGADAELDFGASFAAAGASDTRQHFSIPKGATFFPILQWSDPFYTTDGVKSDLDMYLIKTRSNGVVLRGDTVAISNDDNLASQTPVEGISYTNNNDTDTEFDLVIVRYGGTANPARVKYISYGDLISDDPDDGGIQLEYFTRSSTVTGHHAAIGNISVAAAPAYLRLVTEDFTSKGAPVFLFNPDGSPLAAAEIRAKPDFTSIDGVSTSFFGQKFDGQDPKDGFLFFGTSAAAPNAAAVAALLLQAQPNLTPVQVNERLKNTARDIGAAGFDALAGAGLINAYDAIFGPQTPAAGPFAETFDTPGLSRAWELQGASYGRILVRNDFGPASGPGHLVMDGILAAVGVSERRNIASLRLNLSAAAPGGWVLSFKHKKFAGETDEAMAETFTGNPNVDGVALSVDGVNWFSLTPLTGTAATTSYQTVTVNLTEFAASKNLTLGADVRIRFQHFGKGEVDTAPVAARGGRAFDDVTVSGANVVQAPVAQFSSSSTGTPLCPGSTVQYTNAALFAPTSFLWTFEGGTPATSTDPNPVVTYNTAGTYRTTLTVTNASGSSTRTTESVVVISDVKPTANFRARQAPICPGSSIRFTNLSTNCASTYAWTFAGGTPATSTEMSPTVTFATAGTYTVTLVARNANGESGPKTFTVVVQGAALAVPYAENFASGIPAAWGVLNPNNDLTWTAAPNTLLKDGTRGTAVLMPFFNYVAQGRRDSLQSPTFDLRGQPLANLRFDLAYAPATPVADYNDSLAVFVYAACTSTPLARVYLKSATGEPGGLATALPRPSTPYTPTATSQWRQESVNLNAYLGQQIYLRFVAYNQFGNNLYLSNIRVDNTAALATRAQADSPALQAFPNPVAGGARLTLDLPQARGTATVRVLDALGRVSYQTQLILNPSASTRRVLTSPVAAGLYTVLCQTADGQLYSRRVVVE
ncbi:PKD domain-containing protein [uncultured Hymenobacter sp.]|uniref:PKD domain-containing protein n=1 Tax=uncultured Hymenobacter sp. TaxID=170016 RepID=UPI0035CB3173